MRVRLCVYMWVCVFLCAWVGVGVGVGVGAVVCVCVGVGVDMSVSTSACVGGFVCVYVYRDLNVYSNMLCEKIQYTITINVIVYNSIKKGHQNLYHHVYLIWHKFHNILERWRTHQVLEPPILSCDDDFCAGTFFLETKN